MTSFEQIHTDTSEFDIPKASNDPQPPSGVAFSVKALDIPLEGGTDPSYGTVKWRTLINGNAQVNREFVLGIAEFEPFGTLLPHRHAAAEFYLGLSGSGTVTVEGEPHHIGPGTAIYLPADAEHSVVAGPDGLQFTYGFAEAAFEEIEYRFSAAEQCRA